MNKTLKKLNERLFGDKDGQVEIIKETAEWILCSFFEDRSHRVWLVNKSTEMWTADSSSNDEWTFNFYTMEEKWFSSIVIINPEEFIQEQLEKYHMEVVLEDGSSYFNIKVEV